MPVDIVLFDLGGVLSNFVGAAGMRELAGIESDEEVWRRWLASDWIRRIERDRCTAEQFAVGVVDEWHLPITAEAFLEQFADWVVGPYDGAEALVREVAAHARVGCLSNMCRIHWERTVSRWPLTRLFEWTFLSFQMDLVKPDAEMFRHVVRELAVPPSTVMFLDDNPANVAGADRAGLRAVEAHGVHGARRALRQAGVLVDGNDR